MLAPASGFYLPGVIPHDYKEGERVKVKVNRLDSVRTQLPYEYYSLPFCKPETINNAAENMGEVLRGDRIETSLYMVHMLEEESCKILCRREYDANEMKQFAEKIKDEYRVHWVVDNLPAAYRHNLYTSNPDAPPEERCNLWCAWFSSVTGLCGAGIPTSAGSFSDSSGATSHTTATKVRLMLSPG